MKKDGTQKLCELLYGKCGKEEVKKYLGGSDSQMLHDAAHEIDRLYKEIALWDTKYHELQDFIDWTLGDSDRTEAWKQYEEEMSE